MKIHENLTAEEIVQKAEFYGRKKHKGVFFLVVLSHGTPVDNKEAVLGTNCTPVTIDQLQTSFCDATCSSLRGVPKIFLIDAIRRSRQVITESSYTTAPDFVTIHVHASTHGNQASTDQDQDQGSACTLAQAFVEATKNADPSTPFTEIIQETGAKLQESNPHKMVKSVNTLTRDYCIKRYIPFCRD